MDIISRALSEINSRLSESPKEILLDGHIHRFGAKNHAWYVGHEWEYKSKKYASVTYGSWKNAGEHTVKSWNHDDEDRNFKKSYADHTREQKAKLDIQKQENQKKCKEKWYPIFNQAKTEDHEYLKFKSVKPYNSRVFNNILLIPCYNSIKGFVGVQRIYLDPETKKFEKRFSAGIEIKGAFLPLTPFKSSEYCYLSEGFATAASIQEAFPEIPSICVFNAGNIIAAIEHIRNINPKIKILIAADLDPESKTGEKFASTASRRFDQVIYKLPKFSIKNAAWTDFNDMHNFESINQVKEQIQIDPAEFTQIIFMGYKGDQYFYTSSENPQIIALSAGAHNKGNLTGIVDLPYWYKNYGIKDEDDNYIGVSWLTAESDMKAKCRKIGFFDPEKMRGRGVWIDNKTIVINTGEHVYQDGIATTKLKSEFHYLRTKEIPYHPTTPLNDDEMQNLLSVFASISFKGEKDYIYLASWVIQSQIFGIMPWRFHLWINGQRGAGKSTIMKWIGDLSIRSSKNLNSSAAGIRQDIQCDAIPVIYDESEPDNDRIKEVIEMARQASTNSGFETRRGTPTGKAIIYNTQTCFAMGSIQKGIEKLADISRFFCLELTIAEQSNDEYKEMKHRVNYFIENNHKLFTRCVNNSKTILENYDLCQEYIKKKRIESRLADQLSALISCFWVYLSEEKMTEDQIEYIIQEFDLLRSDYVNDNDIDDADECMRAILSMKVDNQNNSVFYCINQINYLANLSEHDVWEKALGAVGIRFEKDAKIMHIAANSSEIKKRIPEFRGYASIIKRKEGLFIKDSFSRITNFGKCRSVLISTKSIF